MKKIRRNLRKYNWFFENVTYYEKCNLLCRKKQNKENAHKMNELRCRVRIYQKYFSKMTMKIPFIMKKLDEMLENVTCFLKKWDVFMKSVKVYAEKSKLKSKKSDEM